MATEFFESITDVKELKREYIRLIKKYHPDNCNSEDVQQARLRITQEINLQYEKALQNLRERCASEKHTQEEERQNYYYWQFNDEFKRTIHILASYDWVSEIELCGCFLWFKVDYRFRQRLREVRGKLDFDIRYAPKKKRFFICLNRDYKRRTFKEMDMAHIRSMYGSERFQSGNADEEHRLFAK